MEKYSKTHEYTPFREDFWYFLVIFERCVYIYGYYRADCILYFYDVCVCVCACTLTRIASIHSHVGLRSSVSPSLGSSVWDVDTDDVVGVDHYETDIEEDDSPQTKVEEFDDRHAFFHDIDVIENSKSKVYENKTRAV